ncbi:MAG: hypothetical protein CMO01_29710 [Thalassobius sp.]|nr:hypothetical protein [Thalassovita sp.]
MSFNKNNTGLDYQILKNGAVCMYYKNAILDKDVLWFTDNRFEVYDMDVRNWKPKNLHQNLKKHLNFPDYYGENLNAFEDCLEDMYNTSYQGLILVFRCFDYLAEFDKKLCEVLLDIMAKTSREWLLTGQKLIVLIQSTDPNIYFKEVGGNAPKWNAEEWFDDTRK